MQRFLNFHHLRYFWLVARYGNLTRASQDLRVSQSSISAQIRQLELALGHDLFERRNRGLKVTPFGAEVFHYAREIFELGEELLSVVEGEAKRKQIRLRVGSVSTLSRNFQEDLLRPLIGRPGLHLILESGGLEELLERVRSFDLDVVLCNRPITAKPGLDWRCLRIAHQAISLVGPRWTGTSPFRFPRDAQQMALILPGKSSDVRTQVDALWESLNLTPNIVAEVDDMAMLRLLARDGAGVAVVPRVVVKDELREKKLMVYSDLPGIYENFYAVTMKRRRRDPLLNEILRAVQVSAGIRAEGWNP